MKLSDIVSALHLSIFAEVPLVICFGVFMGVVLHVLRSRQQFEELGALPLRTNQAEPEGTRRAGDAP